MRLDAHQHFWRYVPAEFDWIDDRMAALRRDFLPADLQPLLAAADIAGCIAVQARQSLAETRFLLDLARQHAWIHGVVGWVDLQGDDVAAALAGFVGEPALVGLRHIAQAEPDPRFLVSPAFVRGIGALAGTGLAYDLLVHAHQLPAAVELAARFPAQRFVLDHLGKPAIARGERHTWAAHLRALAALPNVTCKLSGMVTEADWHGWSPAGLRPWFDTALQAFGPERLLYGSDWPVCLVASKYARWVETVVEWLQPLPEAQRAAVLGGNAARVYRRGPAVS